MKNTRAVVVDSSVWIEIFRRSPLGESCQSALKGAKILVPTLVVAEVYRKLLKKASEPEALDTVAFMMAQEIVQLSTEVALLAADISNERGLAMADSIVLSHARLAAARLITLDNDFAGLPDVEVLRSR